MKLVPKKKGGGRSGGERAGAPPHARTGSPSAAEDLALLLSPAVAAHLASLKTVFDAVPFGVWMRDRTGRTIFQNSEIVRLWGDQIGRCPEESGVAPGVADAWIADNRRALRGQLVSREVEYPVLGQSRTFRNIVGPFRMGRRIAGVMGFVIDMTDRRAAEDGLRESGVWFRAIFSGAMDGILLADEETRRLSMPNPRICEMLGYTAEELCRMTVADLHPPADLPRVISLFQGQVKGRSLLAPEVPMRRKDGSVFYADINARPIEVGGRRFLVGVFHDISKRKEWERALRLSEQNFRLVLSSTGITAFTHDSSLRYTWIHNPAPGYGDETAVGKTDADLLPPQFAEPLMAAKRAVIESGATSRCEAALPDRVNPGCLRHFDLLMEPVRDERGVVSGLTCMAIDSTARKQAEAALRESELRYRGLFESAGDGIVVIDPETTGFIDFNDEACRRLGYTREEFAKLTIGDLDIDEPADAAVCHARRVLQDGMDSFLARKRCKSGQVLDIEVRAKGIRLSGRDVVLGVWRDVTERRKAEDELRRIHEELKATWDALPDLVFEVDRESRIHSWHATQPDLLFVPPEQFVGRRVPEVLPPDAASVVAGAMAEAAETGRHSGSVYSLDMSGRLAWFELSIAVRGSIREADARFVILVRDITNRRHAEEALERRILGRTAELRESEARLKRVLDSSNDGYWDWNVAENTVFLSSRFREIIGMTPSAGLVTREDVRRTIHPEDMMRVGATVERAINPGATSEHYQLEHRHIRPDGSVVWVFARGTVTERDAAGRALNVSGVATDITERKQAEDMRRHLERQVLEAAEREQQRIGNDLHDGLAQHLAALAYSADDLQARLSSAGSVEAPHAAELGKHLREAINQTRKLAAALQPVAPDPDGLKDSLEDLCDMVRDLMQTRCHLQAEKGAKVTDPAIASHLFRIAQEAVHNAIRHGHAADIWVGLRVDAGALCLTVKDNGKGFAAAEHKKGGIGLNTMRYRANEIGATLDIDTAPGKGTTVTCRVPLHDLPPGSPGRAPATKPKRLPRRRSSGS